MKKKSRKLGVDTHKKFANPDLDLLDFEKLMESSPYQVSGTCHDLIRDAYDHPQPWVHNVHADPAEGKAAFLIGRGWSATKDRRSRIAGAGIPVMAINDYPVDGPSPEYWCSGDPASYFGERIWNDSKVMKFAAMSQIECQRPRTDWSYPRLSSKDAPNVHFFWHVNNETELESWLHLPYISWGTTVSRGEIGPSCFFENGSARSSMLIGIRLLHHLGYRKIFLLGCDCTPGHHECPEYWSTIFHLVNCLKPTFDAQGLKVIQCNPDSHLRTFLTCPFTEALPLASKYL